VEALKVLKLASKTDDEHYRLGKQDYEKIIYITGMWNNCYYVVIQRGIISIELLVKSRT
jgi:hypothetical protein